MFWAGVSGLILLIMDYNTSVKDVLLLALDFENGEKCILVDNFGSTH